MTPLPLRYTAMAPCGLHAVYVAADGDPCPWCARLAATTAPLTATTARVRAARKRESGMREPRRGGAVWRGGTKTGRAR